MFYVHYIFINVTLMGTESEELNRLLLKVNAAMALQQGIEGIREYSKSIGLAAKATKLFNLIVSLNPLTIFLTIITSVIAGVVLFTDTLNPVIEKMKDFSDFLGITNFEEQKVAEERKKRHEEQVKAQQKEIDLLKQKRKIEQEDFDRNMAFLESQGKSTLRLRKARILDQIAEKERSAELFKGTFVERQAQRKLIELRTELNNINKAIRDENKGASKEKSTQDQKAIDDAEKLAQLERDRLSNLEKLKNELLDEIAEVEDANFERTLTEQEKEERAVKEKYFRLIEQAKQYGLDTTELEIGLLNELNDINLEYADKKKAIDDEIAQNKLDAIEQEKIATLEGIDKALEMARKGADAAQAIGDAVFAHKMKDVEKGSKEEEKLARKQFKFNKALQLGGAIIDAGKAITASLAQAPIAIGPVPNPAGIASLAFAATTSAANIAKIAASKFESPGGAASTPSPSGIGGGGEPQAPQFNVVGDSGVNQLAQLQQQPTQAFVVSGEVTTAQALDRNRVQNATL